MARFDGDEGNNSLVDTLGNDELYGYAGNDTLKVTGGNDLVYGDVGLDTLIIDYSTTANGIFNNGGPSFNSDIGGWNGQFTGGPVVSYNSIERFRITTGSGADSIVVADGDDVVNTGAGNDYVDVGSGKDSANGGADLDRISADLSAMTTAIAWNLRTNTFTGTGRSFTNFEIFGTVSGGSAGDTIVSGDGDYNETIFGNGGDDIITVSGGNDTVWGGAGLDTLIMDYAATTNVIFNNGGPSFNTDIGGWNGQFNGNPVVSYNSIERFEITTGTGNDILTTADGNDVVNSGAGDDTVNVGSGVDRADGGTGTDSISADLSTVTAAIVWNLQTNTYSGGGRSFSNFEGFGSLRTGSGNDTIVTSAFGFTENIDAGGGNDVVTVVAGRDGVAGGTGSDRLVIDYSATLNGIFNNGGPSFNTDIGGWNGQFNGGPVVDYNSIEAFSVTTGAGNDSIVVASGDDVVNLGAGDDYADVGTGVDKGDGGTGNDVISADMSVLTTAVSWNLQANTFSAAGGRTFTNFEGFGTLRTGSGNDTIVTTGLGYNENIDAGAGNDTITVVAGSDGVAGGAGVDRLIINYAATANGIYNNGGPSASGDGGWNGQFNGGPVVSYSSIEAFTITTGSGGDSITTADGADVVSTGAGNDYVNVGTGVDSADGGADVDGILANMTAMTTAVRWNLQANTFSGQGRSFANFEYFIDVRTGSGNDVLVSGTVGANEYINAGDGNDTVTVFDGSDTVVAGKGIDTLIADWSAATGDIYNNGGPSLDGTDGGFNGGFSGNRGLSYQSIDNFNITSGAGNDSIVVASGNDTVRTGAGNDYVNVQTGADSADGGDGVDGIDADMSDATVGIAWNLVTNTFSGGPDSFTNFEWIGTITTGTGNDSIVTGATGRNETMNGGDGNDTFTALDGYDVLNGGLGLDTFAADWSAATGDIYNNGGPSANGTLGGFDGSFSGNRGGGYNSVERFAIATGIGNDSITVASGDDVIALGGGDDGVNVGTGADTADGGAGFDGISADLADATGAIVWNLRTNSFSGGPDAFTNFEFLGTITLGGGDDVITTGTGNRNETVIGGAGNDTFVATDGYDVFTGGDGLDTFVGDWATAVGDIYNNGGPAGNGAGGFDGSFSGNRGGGYGGVERFVLTTGIGNDSLVTAAGDDIVRAGAGNDGVFTATGMDLVEGGEGNDSLNGGDDVDTITYASAAAAVTVNLGLTAQQDTIGAGLDTIVNVENLTGSAFGDVLTGSAGANTIDGGSGADTMAGGAGDDTYIVDDAGDTANEAAGEGTDLVRASVSFTLGSEVENLVLTGTGSIDGTGNALANTITGTDGANTLDGRAGADTLIGLGGNDTYVVDDAGDTVTEAADGGTDLVRASVSFTLSANVENLTLTGGDAIDGTGNAIANRVTGNDAANTLDGKAGADTLVGLGGNDTYVVDDAGDVVTEAANGGTDLVRSAISYVLGANLENLTLTGAAADGTGNGVANVITGTDGANTLDGKAGGDTLIGLGGNDIYVVDDAGDTVTEAVDGGTDLVRSAVTFTLSANVENLTLTGTGAIDGTGNALANTITGNAKANTIEGGDGQDTLDGGDGSDTASYAGAASRVTVSLATTTFQQTGGAGSDKLTGFENLLGSNFNDVLTGNVGANTLTGGIGADTLTGGGGVDRLVGGAGTDTAVYTGSFADYDVVADAGGYTVSDRRGGAPDGVDTLTGIERVTLANGTFDIAEVVNAGPTGVNDAASVVEAGRDGPGDPDASGNVLANDLDPNLATAGLGEQLRVTGARAGTSGGFTSVTGATVIDGIYGTLTINADGTYSYALDNTRFETDGLAPGQVVQDVFAYTLADTHGAASQGTLSVDVTGADDTLAADDTVQVTRGRTASLDPNALLANDSGALGELLAVTSVSNATGATVQLIDGRIVISMTAATGGFDYTVTTSGGGSATAHVDLSSIAPGARFVATAPAGITAVDYVGAGKTDSLTGSDGNDRLVGGDGRDTLNGGAGADRLEGGAGNDTYYLDGGADLVIEADGAGTDTVFMSGHAYSLAANVENLVYVGSDDFYATGNAGRNTITGGAGDDVLNGGDGIDTLNGGAGDDRLDGGIGSDIASFAGSTVGVTVDLRIAGGQTTGQGFDTLVSVENVTGSAFADTLTGNDSGNTLSGGGNRDTLVGNGGNDRLVGGGSSDTMTGGTGADAFVFQSLAEFAAGDRITDFTRAQNDKIDLSAIDADASADGQQTFTFIGTAAFTGAGGANYELRYQAGSGGDLVVQGDVNHDGIADFSFLVAAPNLVAGDFVLTPA